MEGRVGSSQTPGLVHYVESGQLIVSWKQHKAFLKDEERAERLQEHNERHGFKRDSPIVNALDQVFECVGEEVSLYHDPQSRRQSRELRLGREWTRKLIRQSDT